jgi:hypothetical protein
LGFLLADDRKSVNAEPAGRDPVRRKADIFSKPSRRFEFGYLYSKDPDVS